MKKIVPIRFLALLTALLVISFAKSEESSAPAVHVELGAESPVLLQSLQFAPSAIAPSVPAASRLNVFLVLKSTAAKTISGLTLRVEVDDPTLAHASVSLPGVGLRKGESISVPLNIESTRSLVARSSRSVLRISLDAVLFADASTYGPDTLQSLRSLALAQAEKKRERQYLSQLLRSGRLAEVRQELNFGLPDTPPSISLAILPQSSSGQNASKRLALTRFTTANAPVQVIEGDIALIADGLSTPVLLIRNVSRKAVRAVNVALFVRDEHVNEFVVSTFREPIQLPPGQQAKIRETNFTQLSRNGTPLPVHGMAALMTSVEFSDGALWIPGRDDINGVTANPELRRILSDSPERQRLASLFRRNGINAVVEDLRKLE